MKRSVLIFGIAMIALLSAGDLAAQRGRSQDRDRGSDRDRREERGQRDRNGQNRDGYRNNDRRNDRGTYRDNRGTYRGNNGYRNRNGRSERVVSHRTVRYDGYRNYGSGRRGGLTVIYDYDYRNGRRFRLERRARPSVRHIWVNGHWRYSRRLQRDVWVGGSWAVQTRNHRWTDGHYERFRGRRTWVPGCWTIIY